MTPAKSSEVAATGVKQPEGTSELGDQEPEPQGSWIYFVDSGYDPEGDVPPYAVIGAWPVDEHGQLGAFTGNPEYRPTPAVLDMDSPTDSVDAALQLAATGHGPDSDVVSALAEAAVYLPADPDGDPIAYRDDDGAEFVTIFSDPSKAPSAVGELIRLDIPTLLSVLPENASVAVNPGSQVAASFTADDLRTALPAADGEQPPAPSGSDAPDDERFPLVQRKSPP